MRKKRLLSLALTLVMVLALAVPASAAAYEYSNGKCTYELSNAPIGTVRDEADDLTILVVPDNTTVISKTVPNGRLRYNIVAVENGTFALYDWDWLEERGAALVIDPIDERDGSTLLAYQIWSEDLSNVEGEIPTPLDEDEDGICVMAQWAVTAGGLTMQPMSAAPAAPAAPATPAATSTGFPDVVDTSAFAPAVKWAVENNITTGRPDGTFAPGETCTQANILTFLWRGAGKPDAAGTVELKGLDGSEYFYIATQWAFEQGLETDFNPNGPCTRSMVVTYLWKLAGSPAVSSAVSFPDVAADAAYAQAVAWAVENGITNGMGDGNFAPDNSCTRGQIVTFLYRNFAK